jgi:Tripartite tricarboxylate transporter family receptor
LGKCDHSSAKQCSDGPVGYDSPDRPFSFIRLLIPLAFTPPQTLAAIVAGSNRPTVTALSQAIPYPSHIPTVAEFVPGYVASQWFAMGLRKNTRAEIIDGLNKELNAVLTDAKIQARLADLGTTTFRGLPAELGIFIVEETEKWANVVKSSSRARGPTDPTGLPVRHIS